MKLRLATFNLESLDFPPRAELPLEQRLPVLRPQLHRLNADVLCLQEINGQKVPGKPQRELVALRRLVEGTPYADFHLAATTRSGEEGVMDKHNLVILSRFPLDDVRQIHHDLVAPPHYRPATAERDISQDNGAICWDRPILGCVVQFPDGQRLHVFNVHFRAPRAAPISGQKAGSHSWKTVAGWAEGFFIAAIKRNGQALELRLAVDAVFDEEPDALVAVCGDFNARDRDTPVLIALGADEDTGSGHLARRMLVPLERSLPEDRRFTVLHHGRPQMLDHIIVSRRLFGYFQRLQIHNEILPDELITADPEYPPPDSLHAPMVAEFEI